MGIFLLEMSIGIGDLWGCHFVVEMRFVGVGRLCWLFIVGLLGCFLVHHLCNLRRPGRWA
jgi:hypothetical protein